MTLNTSTNDYYTQFMYLTDPIPSNKRGFFFGHEGIAVYLTSSKKFQMPQMHFVGFWIFPKDYGEFLGKENISLGLDEYYHFSIRNGNVNIASSFVVDLEKWVYIGYSCEYLKGVRVLGC